MIPEPSLLVVHVAKVGSSWDEMGTTAVCVIIKIIERLKGLSHG